jgi:hypothetical protein
MILDRTQLRAALRQARGTDALGKYGEDSFVSWAEGHEDTKGFVIRSHSAEAGIAAGPRETLVVFPGSNDWYDFVFDIIAYKQESSGGKVHGGFLFLWEDMRPKLHKILMEVDPERNKPVRVSGHSMGGSLAYLAAKWLSEQGWVVNRSFVFGTPRVGDKDWNESYRHSGALVIGIVNDQDLVPLLPPFWGYVPITPRIFLGKDATPRMQRVWRMTYFFLGLPWRMLTGTPIDHRLSSYIKKLEKLEEKLKNSPVLRLI